MLQEVHDNYLTPGHPTAFSAPNNVQTFYDRKYGVKPILDTLQHIDAYTLHREIHKPRVTNPFYVYKKRQQVQMDLIDVSGLEEENGGVTFLILGIDVFTKYIWVRQLQAKSAVKVLAAIRNIVSEMGEKPESIFFDRGKEFVNKLVTTYLHKQGIRKIHPSSEKKAAVVERCNRTLQGMIYKFLAHNQTRTYRNDLPDLVASYNLRRHRTIKMSPTQAEMEVNQPQVFQAHHDHYTEILRKRKKPKYAVGTIVFIGTLANKFHRGYQQTFNFEYFEIVRVNTAMPIPMYFLKSLNDGEVLKGGFYAEELQPVQGSEVYKVDTVLDKRRRGGRNQLFVAWRGFDDTHNSWIDESLVTDDYREVTDREGTRMAR